MISVAAPVDVGCAEVSEVESVTRMSDRPERGIEAGADDDDDSAAESAFGWQPTTRMADEA